MTMMCPHCGKKFPNMKSSLIKKHEYPQGTTCPGTGQTPRNALTDFRPLWKDLKEEGSAA